MLSCMCVCRQFYVQPCHHTESRNPVYFRVMVCVLARGPTVIMAVADESETVGSVSPKFRTEVISQEVNTTTCFQG